MNARQVDRDLFGRPPRGHPNWDHRRGEPRTFALAWTVFLMLATLVMFASMSAALVVSADLYRPATRALILTITAGIVLIWPMVRLSQDRPFGSALPPAARDIVIVLIPVQALIWPQAHNLLGGWSLELCAAIAATQAAWAIIISGLIALALTLDPARGRVGTARGFWMLFVAILVIGVPLAELVFGSIGSSIARPLLEEGMMISPLTAVFELMRDHAGPGLPAIRSGTWLAIGGTSLVGAAVWVTAWSLERARTRDRA
jgi:uncharacterized membrane protein